MMERRLVSFHGYKYKPEDTYKMFDELRKVVLAVKPDVQFWQGENGAPSGKKGEFVGAMKEYDWSELTQSKWNLRRMFGDMGNDVEVTNVFSISDMYYAGGDHMVGLNAKGLLKARPDKTIERPKMAYYAYQHSASIFSEKIVRIKSAVFSSVPDLSAYAYQKSETTGSILTLWVSNKAPVEDASENKTISFTINNVLLKNPVYVDVITGRVYEIPIKQFKKVSNKSYSFTEIPVPDYPVLIADRSLIMIK